MVNKEEFELIIKIVERAEQMGLLDFDRMTLIMDIEHADKQFNLRLEELLNADDFNFAHDIVGIQNHMNRQTGKIEGLFLPRFAS